MQKGGRLKYKVFLILFVVGLICLPPMTYAQDMAALWQKAEQGDAKAQYDMGEAYYADKDYQEAIRWFRLAAEQGNVHAQFRLGDFLSSKGSIPQNYTEAAKWFRLAAEQGHAKAQSRLGCAYYNGYGVQQDYAEAARWCALAAEQGDAFAQSNLGNCYASGNGVPQDYKAAVRWWRLAAEQGDGKAKYNLDHLSPVAKAPELMENTIQDTYGLFQNMCFKTRFGMFNMTDEQAFRALEAWMRGLFEKRTAGSDMNFFKTKHLEFFRLDGGRFHHKLEIDIQRAPADSGIEVSVKIMPWTGYTMSKDQAVDEATAIYAALTGSFYQSRAYYSPTPEIRESFNVGVHLGN